MKLFRNKISALITALMVLFSTGSFAVDMHFCGDTLVDLGFYHEDAKCGMLLPGQEGDCPMSFMDCCEDSQYAQSGSDEVFSNYSDFEVGNDQLAIQPIVAVVYQWQDYSKRMITAKYVPPDIILDLQILHETFLL